MDANEVVISGIGAHFPQCFDVGQFGKNILANKHLPGPTDRWKYDSKLNVDPVCGEISFNCFDDTFFGINKRLALMMDPVAKVGYLRSFEAIIDAGLHPSSVRGHNVGVYAGCGINEYEQVMTADLSASSSVSNSEGYVVMGISRSMFPNRISYYFDLTGPSVAIDSSWAMAHLGLQQAADAISKGSCEAALVIAATISNYPHTASLLKQLGMISDDCITRSFDKDGSGSVRSDCVVAFFLQRADAAKRCYARVLASDIKYTGDHFYVNITLPHPRGLESFLTNMYRTNGIDPARISYLEADGIGNPLRDECELNAIDKVLAQARREKPLLIGSVKSNAGNTDCVSGFVAICKVIVAMETGTIPATLNFHSPSEEVPGLLEGRMKILTSNEPVELKEDSVFAVNTLSMSSMVGHTVLQPNPRASESQEPSAHLPRLITLSGRTEEGLIEVVKKIQSMPFDTNFYRLVQDAFSPDIKGYQFRSFVICPDENQTPIVHRMEKRSTWFLYSGMGSQWAGMAAGLMVLPIFAETIERLHAVLLPKGLDLKTIITETSHEAFNNILKSFVGISACQIALTNVLTAVGLVPDGIIGHSVGELGCAYADGCLTEEQTILAAWARGVASNEATLIKGMMAAIGLGYKDVLPRLPPTIDVACHNSDSSCTLSGPAQDVRSFVEQLSSEGVFAKAVNVSDIAYHSRYIQPAAPFLRKYLQEVIPEPKRRSSRWISTSVPMDKWDSAVFCSAEYQTNNLLSPVLFEEGLAHVPKQSILIEVAPHGLMQAILKRALPDPIHIPLAQRGHADSLRFLLAAIGRTSFGMAAPKVSALYPDVQLPVPRGTATLAGLVTWHADESAHPFKTSVEDEIVPSISLHMDSPVFEVDGSRIFPLSEQLVIMWTLAAAKAEISMSSCPVALRHVLVSSWQVVPKEGTNKVNAQYMSGTKKVELLTTRDSEKHLLVHAFAHEITKYDDVPPPLPVIDMTKHNPNILEKEDLYRNLSLNGLRYPQRFHNISSLEMGETDWIIKVSNEADSWANILESVVQVFLLKAMNENQALCLPRSIQHLDVDPTKISKQRELTLRLHLPTGVLQGPGLYAAGFAMAEAPAAPRNTSALQFVPVGGASDKSLDEFLRLVVSLVLEPGKQDIAVIAIPNGQTTSELSKAVTAAIHASTGVIARTVTVTPEGTQPAGFKDSVPLLVTGPDTVTEAACALAVGVTGAILVWSRERLSGPGGAAASGDMAVLAEWGAERQWVTLLRRRAPLAEPETVVLKMEGRDAVVPSTLPANKTVVLVWQGVSEDDVVATLNIVDARPDLGKARLVFILDDTAPAFSLRHPVYAEQLAMDVRVNILAKGRVWGSQSTLAKLPTKTVKATFSASRLDGVKLEYFGANPLGLSGQAGLSGHVDYVGVLEDNNKTTKVMGVGQWLSDCQRPRLDPLLHWPVPKGWSSADAATVPFVYAVVYLALKVKAEARKGESILVHEGASALGQAAIRVAKQLGCSPIYTTVRNDEQRRLLAQTFPELDNANVLICGDGGSFEYRLRTLTRGRGVRLVVNTLPDTELRASMRCLGFWGRLLHFKRDDMLAARSIGSHIFLTSVSVFGFSGNELFLAHDRDRTEVALAMRQGLQDGTVKPIVGATTFSDVHEVLSSEEFTKAIIKVKETSQAGSSQQCDPNKCYIVVGNQTGAALFVAGKLSVLGARHIVAAVGSPPSSAVVRQQQRTLRRQHGTSLYVHQVQSWTMSAASAVLKAATALAPVHSTVVVVKDDGDVAVPALLSTALSALDNQDEAMVLLSEHTGAVTSLTALVEQRKAQQRRTACMFAPLAEAVRHLEELLCAPPTVTMLPSANAIARVAESHPAECVPHTPASLCALGHAVSRLRRGLQGQDKGPWLREMPSLGPRGRFNRENFPLYAMAPLGVLDADSREQLVGVASKMHSAVFVVETVPDAACSLKDTAAAVVQAILSRQPFGPYNLMGWRLGTVLALEVQRQLEAAGKLGVLFLVHGDVRLVRQWALQQVASPTRHTDPSSQGGAQVVDALAVCLAEHESNVDDAFSWRVHVIRSTVDEQLSFAGDDLNVSLMTVTSTSLNDSAFVHLFNSSGAWSHLAGTNDLRLAINRSDRSDSC